MTLVNAIAAYFDNRSSLHVGYYCALPLIILLCLGGELA